MLNFKISDQNLAFVIIKKGNFKGPEELSGRNYFSRINPVVIKLNTNNNMY